MIDLQLGLTNYKVELTNWLAGWVNWLTVWVKWLAGWAYWLAGWVYWSSGWINWLWTFIHIPVFHKFSQLGDLDCRDWAVYKRCNLLALCILISIIGCKNYNSLSFLKGVMTRSMVDALSELCPLFLKRGNSALIAAMTRGLFPQNEYQSLK